MGKAGESGSNVKRVLTKQEGLSYTFDVTVEIQELLEALGHKAASYQKTSKVKGFRPGKVKMEVIERLYGEQIRKEVVDDFLKQGVQTILEERGLVLAVNPDVSIRTLDAQKGLAYTLKLETVKPIAPVDWSSVSVYQLEASPSQQEIGKFIEGLLRSHRVYKPAGSQQQQVEKEDRVELHLKGSIGGVEVETQRRKHQQVVLGQGQFSPDFEQALLGAKVGERVSCKLSFDQEPQHLAGQTVDYSMEIVAVEKPLPMTIAPLLKVLGHKTEEELTSAVRQRLLKIYQNMSRACLKAEILSKIAYLYKDHPLPPRFLEAEEDDVAKTFLGTLPQEDKKGAEDKDKKKDKTGAQPMRPFLSLGDKEKKQASLLAQRRLINSFVIGDMAKRYNLLVTDEELEVALENRANSYPNPKDFMSFYRQNPEQKKIFKWSLLEEQVINFIAAKVSLRKKKVSPLELEETLKQQEAPPPSPPPISS